MDTKFNGTTVETNGVRSIAGGGTGATTAAQARANLGIVNGVTSYNNLTDKPTIPAAQVNSDWSATSGVEQILNKPELAAVATSGSYGDLADIPKMDTPTGGVYPVTGQFLPIPPGVFTGGGTVPRHTGWEWTVDKLTLADLKNGADFSGDLAQTGQVATWNGQKWVPQDAPAGVTSYNDLTDTPTLGTAAATDSTAYATAAQGALAASASQPGHKHPLSDLTQSSASAGQVPAWNGTAWVPSTRTPNVQVFTGSGTWSKPAGAVRVSMEGVAGGGQGGRGTRVAAGASVSGGGGGGSGGYFNININASDLPSGTYTVTVGSGGSGSTGTGNPGTFSRVASGADSPIVTAGSFVVGTWYEILSVGTTSFTAIGAQFNSVGLFFQATGVGSGTGTARASMVIANANPGGGGGIGVSGSNSAAGSAGTQGGVNGGNGSATSTGQSGNSSSFGTTSGGAGGGCSTTPAALFAGGSGLPAYQGSSAASGGSPSDTGNGGNGTAAAARPFPSAILNGSGGGGGGSSIFSTGNGGNGGNATGYGNGGGGGGSCANASGTAGTGGAGSPGIVVITTYF